MFLGTYRQAVRDREKAIADRDQAYRERDRADQDARSWEARCKAAERELKERVDFFIEREFRLIDRFLTSQAKVPAITDEIRTKRLPMEQDPVFVAQLEAYLEEKKENLIMMAREAGLPAERAIEDFERNRDAFIVDFQQNLSVN